MLSKGATSICIGCETWVPVGTSSMRMSGILRQEMHGLEIALDHRVERVGDQSRLARAHVGNGEEFDLVEMGAALLPVIRETLQAGSNAGLEPLDDIASGAGFAVPAYLSFLVGGEHDQVVVGQHIGKIGAAASQLDDERMLVVRLDTLHRLRTGLWRPISNPPRDGS